MRRIRDLWAPTIVLIALVGREGHGFPGPEQVKLNGEASMQRQHFGTTDEYAKAIAAVVADGVPEKHIELLRAHLEAPRHTTTARQLAAAVGYANHGGVNMQYGTFAHRVASYLGVVEPPNGFWLFVLVDWSSRSDPSGDTRFVLRAPVIEALQRLGYPLGGVGVDS